MKKRLLSLVAIALILIGSVGPLRAATPASWSATNVIKGTDSMIVYASVKGVHGIGIKDTNSLLAAFAGNNLAGIAAVSPAPGGASIYAIQIFGSTNTTGIGFAFYNSTNANVDGIATNITYAAGTFMGSITNPISLPLGQPLAAQGIYAFAPIGAKTYQVNGSNSFPITAPLSNSRLPVNVSVQSGPATITGNTVTITGKGTVVLVANQPGNANYNAANPVKTSFVVK